MIARPDRTDPDDERKPATMARVRRKRARYGTANGALAVLPTSAFHSANQR